MTVCANGVGNSVLRVETASLSAGGHGANGEVVWSDGRLSLSVSGDGWHGVVSTEIGATAAETLARGLRDHVEDARQRPQSDRAAVWAETADCRTVVETEIGVARISTVAGSVRVDRLGPDHCLVGVIGPESRARGFVSVSLDSALELSSSLDESLSDPREGER